MYTLVKKVVAQAYAIFVGISVTCGWGGCCMLIRSTLPVQSAASNARRSVDSFVPSLVSFDSPNSGFDSGSKSSAGISLMLRVVSLGWLWVKVMSRREAGLALAPVCGYIGPSHSGGRETRPPTITKRLFKRTNIELAYSFPTERPGIMNQRGSTDLDTVRTACKIATPATVQWSVLTASNTWN